MDGLRALTIAAVAACATPCAGQTVPVQRIALPGFTIAVPAGSVLEDSKEPSGGQHLRQIAEGPLAGIEHLSDPLVEVAWLTQSMTFEQYRDQLLPAIAANQPNAVPGERVLQTMKMDRNRWLALYGTPQMPIGMGMVVCNPGFSVSIKLRLHGEMKTQLAATRAMLESVRCLATANVAKRPEAPVRFEEGFGRMDQPPAQFYHSLDGEHIAISFTQGESFSDPVEWQAGVLAVMEMELRKRISAQWARPVQIREREDFRPSRLLRIDLPGDARPIYFGGFQCVDLGLSFLVSIELPEANDALAERRLAQIGCPGDAGRDVPPFSTVVTKACAAGDTRACALSR